MLFLYCLLFVFPNTMYVQWIEGYFSLFFTVICPEVRVVDICWINTCVHDCRKISENHFLPGWSISFLLPFATWFWPLEPKTIIHNPENTSDPPRVWIFMWGLTVSKNKSQTLSSSQIICVMDHHQSVKLKVFILLSGKLCFSYILHDKWEDELIGSH